MRKSNESTIREALNEMIQEYGLEEKLVEVDAIKAWEQLVGPVISKHTRHLYVKNRKLIIKLDSAPLKQELSYKKTTILEKINELLGKEWINEVVIR